MSGRNQHHFWQALQRGFGVERKPDYTTIYVYQKSKAPFSVNTRKFGAERDFFDIDLEVGADDLITEIESSLQGLVKLLQSGGPVVPAHAESISLLISHLEIRTKFIRQHFAESFSGLMDELDSWFSSPNLFKKMMKRYLIDHPDEIDSMLAKQVDDPSVRAAIARFAVDNFDALGSAVSHSSLKDAADLMKAVAVNMAQIAKRSHIEAILKTTANSPRKARYRELNYGLKSGFAGNLICPDTMVAFLTDRKPKPFLDKDDRLEAVWIPLTSDLMLIGEPGARADRANDSVLRALASTSFTSFIAAADTLHHRRLSSRIGSNAQVISATDIKAIKRNTLTSLT